MARCVFGNRGVSISWSEQLFYFLHKAGAVRVNDRAKQYQVSTHLIGIKMRPSLCNIAGMSVTP